MTIQIRNYNERDLELVVVLLNAVDAVDRMEQGTSLSEKREFLGAPELAPAENLFVAEDESGRLIGLAGLRVFHEGDQDGFRSWLEVHPVARGRGLEDRLLARLEQRAQERLTETPAASVYLSCASHTADREKQRAIARAGMTEIRRFWVMVRPGLSNLSEPRWPEGFEWRTPRLGEDDEEALDALNDSFSEHFAHTEETLESFRYYLRSALYRPDLTVIARERGSERIAGFCHVAVNAGECERLGRQRGWIDILGVRKEYRRRGLGEALILQGMHNLRRAGMTEAALGCDAENTTQATRLYFRAGYRVVKTTVVYNKLIHSPELAPAR